MNGRSSTVLPAGVTFRTGSVFRWPVLFRIHTDAQPQKSCDQGQNGGQGEGSFPSDALGEPRCKGRGNCSPEVAAEVHGSPSDATVLAGNLRHRCPKRAL